MAMCGRKITLCYLLLEIFAVSTGFLLESESCSSELPLYYTRISTDSDHTINSKTLVLQSPNLVTKIGLNLSSCPNIYASHPEAVTSMPTELTFIEASNPLRAHTSFFKAGPNYDWKIVDTSAMLYLDVDPTYTRTVTLTTLPSLACANLSLYGCPKKTSVCSLSTCRHGVCVGNGFCSCVKGYFADCSIPISSLAVDNFELTSSKDDNLLTVDGRFKIYGSVSFEPVTYKSDAKRYHHSVRSHHGGHKSAHFHGHGGHISLVQAYCGDAHAQHRCANSTQSVFNHHHGFCHSNSITFSVHHDHHHEIHFYNTHSHGHVSAPGSSLSYQDNQLHMNVNNGNQTCNVSAPWQPTENHTHTVASSYSPHYGCSIYVDGHHIASAAGHNDPSQSLTSSNTNLCIGSCRSDQSDVPIVDYLVDNIKVVGATASELALNGLLGLLVYSVSKLALNGRQEILGNSAIPTPTNAVTTSHLPTTTTATTKTTTPTRITTKATKATQTTTMASITTTPKTTVFTATKINTTTTANIPTGSLICYSCQDSPIDGACKAIMQCQAGEVCSVFKDSNGYTHTCLDKHVCNVAKSIATSDCWICCSSTLCNKQCRPTVQCQDTPNCGLLKSTGYDVCHDQAFATTECKKTCGHCPSG